MGEILLLIMDEQLLQIMGEKLLQIMGDILLQMVDRAKVSSYGRVCVWWVGSNFS